MHFKYSILALAMVGLMGCTSTLAPDVTGNIRNSLQQAGLKDITVTQDRDKGVVTLGGHVTSQAEKDRAEQIVKPLASGQVVANDVTVQPASSGSASRAASPEDQSIRSAIAAAFSQAGIHGIRYSENDGVVTLSGMTTATTRAKAESLAAGAPNVKRVVNRIAVRKAHASKTATDEECDSATVVDIEPCEQCE